MAFIQQVVYLWSTCFWSMVYIKQYYPFFCTQSLIIALHLYFSNHYFLFREIHEQMIIIILVATIQILHLIWMNKNPRRNLKMFLAFTVIFFLWQFIYKLVCNLVLSFIFVLGNPLPCIQHFGYFIAVQVKMFKSLCIISLYRVYRIIYLISIICCIFHVS